MREQNKWLFEFSKKVVRLIVSVFISHIVFVDALAILMGDTSFIGQITDCLTQVTIVCLGGYLFKATLENVFKIKDHYNNDYS